MSKPKLGPWHPADQKPVHVGVYETKDTYGAVSHTPEYRNWNGTWWGAFGDDRHEAKALAGIVGGFEVTKWRGLAEQPK